MLLTRSFTGALVLAALTTGAGALQATPLRPAFDLRGPGLSIAVAGAGMLGPTGRSPKSLTLVVGGPVELALLYWAGRDRPCPEEEPGSGRCVLPETGVYKDQVISFDGLVLTGELIGSEIQPDTNAGPINNLGYFADVTEIVRAKGTGPRTFTVADGDPGSNLADLDGAGLLVIYTNLAKDAPARVIVYHGLDFAYGEDRTRGETEVTDPFTFNHGAARASARRGELVVFVGDAESKGPDRIDVSRNPSLANKLDGSSGALWDVDRFPVNIPARAGATTVQIFSEPLGLNPDSLLWVAAALWVPLPVPTGCSEQVWSRLPLRVWVVAGYRPDERVKDSFKEAAPYEGVGTATLAAALRFSGGGPGLLGAAGDLVRAGTAAVLNAAHAAVEYPWTRTQVITLVDTALRNRDEAAIRALARELEAANNAANCPLD
jgi:hypothetical protein